MKRYDYCKVYLSSPVDRSSISEAILEVIGGKKNGFGTIEAPDLVVEVRRNEDADETSKHFAHWPIYLDIERLTGVSDQRMVEAVSRILNRLWQGGIDAVAACDFEDELPMGGGYLKWREIYGVA